MNGSLQKYKARMCVRGDIQNKITTEPMNDYAPVVQWSAISMLLIMTYIVSLKTTVVDFSNAFLLADIKGPLVYMNFPP